MTTTTSDRRGPQPDRADINRVADRLAGLPYHRDRYPYTCGALGEIIRQLADQHSRCRKPHCHTCTHLRRGLAYLAALDEGETR